MSRIFVTGASGFVGSAVVAELVSRRHAVHALTHRRTIADAGEVVRQFQGDLFDPALLDAALRGCDAVIHLVGIIMEKPSRGITFERIHYEGTRSVVDAAIRNGVRRFIQMSALGTRPDAASEYHRTKFQAEEYVRASGLEWTIFRPSLIHGPRGEFMRTAVKWARRTAPPFLFMPYFGAGVFGQRGAGMLQPVYVEDVARAFADALENPRTVGEVYPIAGPDRMTWPELHRTIAQTVAGRRRWVLPIPVWKAKLLAAIGIGRLAGFNRDQIVMSQEDNTCDVTKFVNDFGWSPAGFESALKGYAARL